MDLTASIAFGIAVASLALLVVYPAAAYGQDGADFRGICSQKNVLGEAMTIGALASLHGMRVGNHRRWRNAIYLATLGFVALKSQSATSCLTIAVFCLTDFVIVLLRKGGAARILATLVIIVAIPALVGVAVFPDLLLTAIGKDPTLTGRTEIWNYVIAAIYQKPLLGWGYLAFWSFANPVAMQISDLLHWFVPQSHNGLLEILLYVGVIGAAFFIFLWLRTVLLSVRCLKSGDPAVAITCLLSCAGIILVGISETVLIDPFEASTSIFFITGLFCERALRVARVQVRPPAKTGFSAPSRFSGQSWRPNDQKHASPAAPTR
jgi:O-antigen ligase